jgi:hypothetical protein
VPTNLVVVDNQRGMAAAPADTPRTIREFESADERGERVIAPVPTNLVVVDNQRGMAAAPADTPRTIREFESAVRDSMRTAADRNKQKMSATPPVKPQPVSIVKMLAENRLLFILALLGIALSAWQLRKR